MHTARMVKAHTNLIELKRKLFISRYLPQCKPAYGV